MKFANFLALSVSDRTVGFGQAELILMRASGPPGMIRLRDSSGDPMQTHGALRTQSPVGSAA
eukprot:753032-Hanusia_phi.AAC.2